MKHIRMSTAVLLISSFLLSVPSPAAHAQSAPYVLIDWNPSWNSDWGAAKQPSLEPITTWLTLQKDAAGDTVLWRDGKEFVVFGTGCNQAVCAIGASTYMTDADMDVFLRRLASLGYNTLRMQGWGSKNYSSTGEIYGMWASSSGATISEKYMVQLDKEIAKANQLGIQIIMGGFYPGQWVSRKYGLADGTCGNYGMGWSDRFDAYTKEFIGDVFAKRVNTITGVRYIDNPGIIWQTDNEHGITYGFFSNAQAGCFTNIATPGTAAYNEWGGELNTKILNYYAERGWTLPGGKFPLKSTWSGWSTTDKKHFMSFMGDMDVAHAKSMYTFLKSLNPKAIALIGTYNYMDGRHLEYSDMSSFHNYSRVPSGDPITQPPNYQPRTSQLRDNNGFAYWQWGMGGARLETTPLIQPETGDYGLNRWDYERTILEAIVHDLQKTSGFVEFHEGQQLHQVKAKGIEYIHIHQGWPSRQLSSLLAAPILEYRMVNPLPDKVVGVIGTNLHNSLQVSKVSGSVTFWYATPSHDSNGAERGYWRARTYVGFSSASPDTLTVYTNGKPGGEYPKVTDAEFAAGIQVPGGQVYASTRGVTINTPYVVGLVNDLKNTTIGPMTLSGVTPMENAVVMIRSDAKYPLFTGPAKLFVHSHSTVTNAAGFSLTTDNTTVTSWGSPENTRLVVPLPLTITFNTGGVALDVSGVNDDGTTVALPTTFDGTNVRFSTDTRFPLYLVVPRQSTTFIDVPATHPYYAEIEALYRAGYTAGCSTNPLMYCPDATMNRAESAVFVERGIHSASYAPPVPSSQVFADVPLDSWAASWVDAIWQDRFTQGCGTNPLIYCPWQGHTRAEGSVFYLRMLNGADYVPPPPTQQLFVDVPLDAWYAAWMHAAYGTGILPACQTSPDVRLCPEGPLSRGLAAHMMVKSKELP